MKTEQICTMSRFRRRRVRASVANTFRVVALLAGPIVVLSGCGVKQLRSAPPTYPVRGQIKAVNGKLPVGGCVEFKPDTNQDELTSVGVIDKEGKFTLSIPFVDRVIPGATAGPHRAYIVMPLDAASRTSDGRVLIPGTFVVATTDNEFTINMPNAPK